MSFSNGLKLAALVVSLGFCCRPGLAVASATLPPPFLLKTYPPERLEALDPTQPLADFPYQGWLLSEKYDGIRARWDGQHLVSRQGNRLHAPKALLQGLPPFALDGELWLKRGAFAQTLSIVMQQVPDGRWRQLTYQVFDVPKASGGLRARLQRLRTYLKQTPEARSWVHVVKQTKLQDSAHFKRLYQQLKQTGAEGAVIRAPDRPYKAGRTADALKVKTFLEAECQVRGYRPGQGRLEGLVGALRCQPAPNSGFSSDIYLGTGLSDAERADPPEKGQWVTFKYYGLTRHQKPRFPVFLRVGPHWQPNSVKIEK